MKALHLLLFLGLSASAWSEPKPYVPPPLHLPSDEVGSFITVQKGDTLSRLARRHRVTVSQLRAANGLKNDLIRIGQRLRLPSQTPQTTAWRTSSAVRVCA